MDKLDEAEKGAGRKPNSLTLHRQEGNKPEKNTCARAFYVSFSVHREVSFV